MSKLGIGISLIGQDGNIFNLMSLVTRAMKQHGFGDQVDEFRKEITSCRSYEDAICVILDWVEIQ